MKDNRSLEQKIKEVHQAVVEAAFDRNTKIRMKMSNVGRPTDNVKDETSKLAKQGEIKTKVIDEETLDDWAKKHEKAGNKITKDNKTAIYHAWDKDNKHLGAYKANNKVKEEVIGEDTVASVSTKDTPKEQPDSGKQKKSNNKNLVEPGTIKGGKTEVDLEPTTDDRDDNGKKINKNEKATKAANAKAGVKEETMTTKNFGLPADLIKTVSEAMGKCTKCAKKPCMCEGMEEELKGGQKNLDKNHNGKLDKQDFEMLRGKKSAKSEKMKAYRADRDKHGEMEEELKGNQHKIDANKNGKIDSQDFKMLRGKKKMEEETDPGFSEAELSRIEEIAKGL